ncbi:MAG: bifunctional demethylmenaquinone methyltransferase/2-methoxy-6-polyprenyl-1,4-benzoquinol methylase UbiE [bacterium]
MPDVVSKDPDRIREMFDNVADRYDQLNRLLSLGLDRSWRDRMIRNVQGKSLLDVACGSGDVLQQAATNFSSIYGLDFSQRMLQHAQDKVSGDRALLCSGDALDLPFKPSTFDAVTCAFGVRNFADRQAAFREVNRVLTPNSNFVILEFFPPPDSLLTAPLRWYMGTVLPFLGKLISQSDDAYEYLNRSIKTFVDAQTLTEELSSSGFKNCTVESVFLGLVKLIIARKGGH